jgi:hypothetical protein
MPSIALVPAVQMTLLKKMLFAFFARRLDVTSKVGNVRPKNFKDCAVI